MNQEQFSPQIKSALAKDIKKQMPVQLHARILQQLKAVKPLQITPPDYTGYIILALLFGISCIALPFVDLNKLNLTDSSFSYLLNIPLYVWESILMVASLYAMNEWFDMRRIKRQL